MAMRQESFKHSVFSRSSCASFVQTIRIRDASCAVRHWYSCHLYGNSARIHRAGAQVLLRSIGKERFQPLPSVPPHRLFLLIEMVAFIFPILSQYANIGIICNFRQPLSIGFHPDRHSLSSIPVDFAQLFLQHTHDSLGRDVQS